LYYAVLPKDTLEEGLVLEAQRMRELQMSDEELRAERGVIEAERLSRLQNPDFRSGQELLALAYDSFAYRHPTMGVSDDLEKITRAQMQSFFRAYYRPNNAVIALVGDLDAKRALQRVTHYFGEIPRGDIPELCLTASAQSSESRRIEEQDALARFPLVDVAYRIAVRNASDKAALEAARVALVAGDNSRLRRALMKERELAVAIRAWLVESEEANLFRITVTGQPAVVPEEIETTLDRVLGSLTSEPLTASEMQQLRIFSEVAKRQMRENSLGRAIRLAEQGSLNDLWESYDRFGRVTPADVARAAATCFQRINQSIVITVPMGRGTTNTNSNQISEGQR
jgi:predicted Zn-dependent peptidase